MGKKSEHGQSRYYPDIYLIELRKTTNMLSQDSWYPLAELLLLKMLGATTLTQQPGT